MNALAHVLSADPPPPPSDVTEWWARARTSTYARSGERALVGGFESDRIGFAFASGYQAATGVLFGADRLWALCASEAAGGHPRAIQTTLDGGAVTGTKTFVTFGAACERLAVIARVGEVDGRPDLRLVQVDPTSPGVTLHPGPNLPMVPEVPHASVTLEGAEGEVLPGDAYTQVLKPFRTVEDIHVHLALLGLLFRACRGDTALLQELAAHATTLMALARKTPDDPVVHVALGGCLARCRELIDAADTSRVPHWERDRALLGVAGRARARRLEVAWSQMSS